MMRRRSATSVAANPILIGAVTVTVIVVTVLLAYNANQGLPFVPTYTVKVETRNGQRLVVGNEVREGGERIGQVTEIETVGTREGTGAMLTLKLDRPVGPLPDDTQFVIRPKSTLGLKYVDLLRGSSKRKLADGSVVAGAEGASPPEIDDFFEIFDERTRRDVRENLVTYGTAFAGRGEGLNRTFAALPELLGDLEPVMRTLAARDTNVRAFFGELADFMRVTAPVSDELAEGFTTAADTFEAFSRDPEALDQTIAESPETLAVGIRTLPVQRRLFAALSNVADETTQAARALQTESPAISRALAAGTEVLPRTTRLSADLRGALQGLGALGRSPMANLSVRGLQDTTATLNPTLRWLGPHVTVCNYVNYFFTFFADHLAQRVPSGTLQRIQVKSAPSQTNGLTQFGATAPADGSGAAPEGGDPVELHAQPYGRAVDEQGRADCEQGQRGYPDRLAKNAPPDLDIAVDPRTPGNQGPTFTGRPRVPDGQTFSAEPDGRGPRVAGP